LTDVFIYRLIIIIIIIIKLGECAGQEQRVQLFVQSISCWQV